MAAEWRCSVAKMRVILDSGRVVEGEITTQNGTLAGGAVLLADGKQLSALQAVNNGIRIDPITDPIVDVWLNTF
jgi:hypothetical protein